MSASISKESSKIDIDVNENHCPSSSDTNNLESSRSVEEFLEKERQCASSQEDTVDIENIFDEINRLNKNTGRSLNENDGASSKNIEDILFEAEKLVTANSRNYSNQKLSPRCVNISKRLMVKKSSSEQNCLYNGNQRRHTVDISCNGNKISHIYSELKSSESNEKNIKRSSSSKNSDCQKTSTEKVVKKYTESKHEYTDDSKNSSRLDNDITERRFIALQEELKDTNESLKSIQVQYEALVNSYTKTKNDNKDLSYSNRVFELKVLDLDDTILKAKKEIEISKTDKVKLEANQEKNREETYRLIGEKKELAFQVNRDKMTILDLQRQCKEMEAILARRHPDSVSALIVASKHPALEKNTKNLLEKRIGHLEKELKDQDHTYQKTLSTVQDKVNAMRDNYETHISDLEKQVVNLQLINSEIKDSIKPKNCLSVAVQTDYHMSSIGIQTVPAKPQSAKITKSQVPTASNNLQVKEDTHMLATVRGLNSELTQKDKAIAKLNRELDDSKKTIMKLQKGKEVFGKVHIAEKVTGKKSNGKIYNSKVMKHSMDSLNVDAHGNKENDISQNAEIQNMKKDLNILRLDYENLKKKRIADLFALQTAHEKELMNLNVKVMPLRDDVESLNTTVEMLRNQIKLMDEQLSVIVMERDNYKYRADLLNLKLVKSIGSGSDRSTKSSSKESDKDYDSLKMKVVELEKRYEGREIRLKTLVNSLAKLKDSQLVSNNNSDSGFVSERLLQSGSCLPY